MDAKEVMRGQKDLLERVDVLERNFDDLSTLISRIGIDRQFYVKANDPVSPGTACKITFDQYGLVRSGNPLDISDIPDLPIEKIINLREMINQRSESTVKREIPSRSVEKKVSGTATKVNYDDEGKIISSVDLTPSDIPDLPIEKIDGLLDRLKIIDDIHRSDHNPSEFKVCPGMGVKITYDSSGRVLKSDKLSIEDLPHELVSRLNILEGKMLEYASNSIVNSLKVSMEKKLDANEYMTPGTYMKVKVDHKGLIIGYEEITKKDLPSVTMADIEGLEKILRSKADQSSLVGIHETLASLSSLPSKISEITSIRTELSKKADQEELSEIKNQVSSVNSLLQTVMDKIPNDTIVEFLNQIQDDISNLSGRIASIENKLSEK